MKKKKKTTRGKKKAMSLYDMEMADMPPKVGTPVTVIMGGFLGVITAVSPGNGFWVQTHGKVDVNFVVREGEK